jgi:hypothetical protein
MVRDPHLGLRTELIGLWELRDIPLVVGGTAQKSSLGLTAPKDMLGGHQQEIQSDRDLKLEAAREQRKKCRQRAA